MFVLGNFLYGLAIVLDKVIGVVIFLVVVRALISWVNPDPNNMIVIFLYRLTEPILAPFRKLMPRTGVPIDFSPLLAILFLYFTQAFLVRTLFDLASHLR